jgi:MarR family transcriptional regulator, organic hydroperoxide resistance regulator
MACPPDRVADGVSPAVPFAALPRPVLSRTVTAGYEQLELDRQLCFALYAASRAVVRAYGTLLEGAGLTYPQYATMMVLWEDPEQPITVGDLGHRLHLDNGTLTPLLKRLEAAGYLRRTRDSTDERRVLVVLSPSGLELRDEVKDVPFGLARLTGMNGEQLCHLRDQLIDLTRRLDADTPSTDPQVSTSTTG